MLEILLERTLYSLLTGAYLFSLYFLSDGQTKPYGLLGGFLFLLIGISSIGMIGGVIKGWFPVFLPFFIIGCGLILIIIGCGLILIVIKHGYIQWKGLASNWDIEGELKEMKDENISLHLHKKRMGLLVITIIWLVLMACIRTYFVIYKGLILK